MSFSWKNPLKALPALLFLASYAGAAFGLAGHVQFVIGDVKLTNRAGQTRALQKGAAIDEGDRIVTADGATAQIKMVDGGFIAVRPNTDMGFDTYHFAGKEDGTESAVVSLLRGGFRTITGIIGRTNKQNYLVKTPTATIGIRGTDHEPMVILAPAPGQAAIAPPGTYDKVNVGVAFIRTDAGSIDILRNQVGFAPVSKVAPVLLPTIPPFYKPTPAPRPRTAATPATAGGQRTAAASTAKAAEEPAPIRSSAVVDPTSTVTAAPAAPPAAVAPVVAVTATNESGNILNTTTQTVTTSSGATIPITQATANSTGTVVPKTSPPTGNPTPPPPIINPVVAAGNYDFGVTSVKPATGGVERTDSPTAGSGSANTNFVFSNMNLVEILKSPYQRFGINYQAQPLITSADIKFSGGVAADAASDPNGTYYLGRWSGGQIAVTDLATTSPVAPFTDPLGATSAHWILGLTPGYLAATNLAGNQINNVQQLVGTANFSLAAATHPTDAFGNVGTLNSATLAANFSAQTLNAGLNLSFSSTDTVNVSKRNFSLAATATNVPILSAGFQASGGGPFAPTVTCSGTDCASSGYAGGIGGMFLATASGGTTTGAVGTGAAIGYGFAPVVPSPVANQPYTDFIQGVAVLSTGAAPTVGAVTTPIAGGTGTYRQQAFAPQTVGSGTYFSTYSLASGVAANTQNYLFDTSGNLVRIQSSDYRLSDRGSSTPPSYSNGAFPYTGTPGGLPSSPLTGTAVSFSGGTTPDGNYNDTVNSIRMGRYAGGTITTTDFSTSASPQSYYTQLGSNSLNWAVRELPVSVPLTGSFEYTPSYSTKPTDSLGNAGTLNYASLAANFTTQTVSPTVAITINNQNLSAAGTNVPIDSQFGFDVSTSAAQNASASAALRVSCYGSNCAPAPVGVNTASPLSPSYYLNYVYSGYGGRITGGLAGASTAGGAFFRYTFDTYYNPTVAADGIGGISSVETRPVNDYVNGLVAFTKGTNVAALAPSTATTGSQRINTSYFETPVAGAFNAPRLNDYSPSAASYTSAFGTGSPNSVTDYDPGNATPHSEILTAGTVTQAPTNANSFAATGISFGRYGGGTVTGFDWHGTALTRSNLDNYAWIKGPTTPLATQALTATARYAFDGGTLPKDTLGNSGTVNSALLATNFNNSSVGIDLSVSIPATSTTWTATTSSSGVLTGNPTTSMKMYGDGSFFGSNWQANANVLHENLFVKLNGGTTNASNIQGQINGQLMGPNLSGAGLSYTFQDRNSNPGIGVNGAVAFVLDTYTSSPNVINASGSSLPTQTTTTGTSAIDLNAVPYQIRLSATGLIASPTATPVNAPASVDDQYFTRVTGQATNTGRLLLGTNGLPIAWDGQMIVTTVPTCAGCTPFVRELPARASIDPANFVATGATPAAGQIALPAGKSRATVLESGFDAATGMRWGRYGGGVIALFDRIGGNAPGTYDVTTQNLHTILSPTMVGPTMLPVTGTYTYSNVGGTKPTDNLGNVGTLNAATLVADFAAQTVNTGVNLTVNNQTWAAGGTAVPIQQGRFQAGRDPSGGGNLNICVGSTCGTTTLPTANTASTSGKIVGAFNGSSGQGVGIAYSLNQGGLTGTTVSGVAAFNSRH